MLHDRADLGSMEIGYEMLVKLSIRNSLQIPSTSLIKQYFEEHIRERSATCGLQRTRARK